MITKILIVEDELISSGELIRLIKKDTIQATTIETVQSMDIAMTLLKDHNHELVIFNLELPGAFEFLDFAIGSGVCLIMTINDTPENRIAARLIELDYLAKPFNPVLVKEMLGRYKQAM
ncbi:MAG: hypothetical protein WDN26_03880 [Chitinophagaceae bacterium]